MPIGRVTWFDARTQEGAIGHAGHTYPVRAEDMEPEARLPLARVHFDVDRSGNVERAVGVRVAAGTRSGYGQSRSGLDSGAHHPDDRGGRGLTRGHPERRARHPESNLGVVREWLDALSSGRVQVVLAMYSPDAAIHGEHELAGRGPIESWIESSPLLGRPLSNLHVAGEGEVVRVDWRAAESALTDVDSGTVRLRVEHARICEQWS